jgi:hypothetical protein
VGQLVAEHLSLALRPAEPPEGHDLDLRGGHPRLVDRPQVERDRGLAPAVGPERLDPELASDPRTLRVEKHDPDDVGARLDLPEEPMKRGVEELAVRTRRLDDRHDCLPGLEPAAQELVRSHLRPCPDGA